jgi:hypothetical protein
VSERSKRSARSAAMPAFDPGGARRIFCEVEDDAEPVAVLADDLKIRLVSHCTPRFAIVVSKQSRQAEYDRLPASPRWVR